MSTAAARHHHVACAFRENTPCYGRPMTELNLKTFEKKIRTRHLKASDYDDVVALQLRCFPGMKPWAREQFESQVKIFPEGQVGVIFQKRLVASSSALILTYDEELSWHNWREVADDGFIRNHDPDGDTLYGIEIMVDPDFRGMKLSRRLYNERKTICRQRNLMRSIVGGRIPGYKDYADRMSATEYVEQVMDRNIHDPVLTAQIANGFVLKRLIPNYLPGDTESRGYATFLEWTNLEHAKDPRRRIHTVAKVRLAAVQYQMRAISGFSEFGKQCEFFVDVAADYRSDFVLFPEMITNQLLSCVKSREPAGAVRQLGKYTNEYLELFTKLAIKYNVNIVGGTHFAQEEGTLYNVAYLFRRDGTIGKQYKIHITPSERRWWGVNPGDDVVVFDTDCGKVAILICYDIEFPELSRIAVSKGANIIFVPFNTDTREGYLRVRYCAQARCVENQVFVAISGPTGNLPFVDNVDIHYAQSGIFTPSDFSFARDGIAGECTANIETVVIHDVDTELLRRARAGGTVTNWADRRTDLYQVTYKQDGKTRQA